MKLKKLTAVSFALILCLGALASCGGKTEDGVKIPSGMQAIASEMRDYYLMVPKDWAVDTTKGMTSAYAEDAAHSSVTVCANALTSATPDIEAYWASFTDEFEATFDDFTLLDKEPTDVTFGANEEKIEGKKYRYTATVGGVGYQWMQVLFVHDGNLFVFTYTSTQDAYEDTLDEVEEILANFTFCK